MSYNELISPNVFIKKYSFECSFFGIPLFSKLKFVIGQISLLAQKHNGLQQQQNEVDHVY